MRVDFEVLRAQVDRILGAPSPRDAKLKAICYLLRERVPHYDWVGFYFVDPRAARELVLGPYAGASTEHTRIPFGTGVCGHVAETEETMVVDDVRAEENYLACSLDVRAEIVVPIFKGGRFVAQIDIDSHAVAPFGAEDRSFLEAVAHAASAVL